jgi:hypothetical protein
MANVPCRPYAYCRPDRKRTKKMKTPCVAYEPFFDFLAFFFGTFDLDLAERANALMAGIGNLSFSLATPSDSESDDNDREPTFATAAAADAPGDVDVAAAAAEDVLGVVIKPLLAISLPLE